MKLCKTTDCGHVLTDERLAHCANCRKEIRTNGKPCKADACPNLVMNVLSAYCVPCRRKRRLQEFATKCMTPECGGRFFVRARSLEAVKAWKNKFCPSCRERFGGRFVALRLQVDQGAAITDIIVTAGRSAFDWYSEAEGRDVLTRFGDSLGVSYHTLHDWLQFFFGLSWPDWKRRFICAGHSCSIVDVSALTSGRPKYYVVDQLRRKGICSCPIKGDDLILIDRRPDDLTPDALQARFTRSAGWTKHVKVVSGSHLELLPQQEHV